MSKEAWIVSLCCLFSISTLIGQSTQTAENENGAVCIEHIYADVSGASGSEIDWGKVRSYFTEDAIIVLRTSLAETKQFTVEGFIQDFQDFYENPVVQENGFKEEVVKLDAQVYKEMAFIKVVYEASIPNLERPPQRGLDYWLLVKRGEEWKVLAVTNEVLSPGEELPADF